MSMRSPWLVCKLTKMQLMRSRGDITYLFILFNQPSNYPSIHPSHILFHEPLYQPLNTPPSYPLSCFSWYNREEASVTNVEIQELKCLDEKHLHEITKLGSDKIALVEEKSALGRKMEQLDASCKNTVHSMKVLPLEQCHSAKLSIYPFIPSLQAFKYPLQVFNIT